MYDTYIFAQNGSNITVTVSGLAAGRYHFYCYGHADPDVTGEQNSVFTLKAGTNTFGPITQMGGGGWKAGNPWQERAQYVVFRDVPVDGNPVVLDVAPGPNGVAVLNGLQIISRGTSPPRLLVAGPPQAAPASTNLLFREIRYEGKVSDTEARFAVTLRRRVHDDERDFRAAVRGGGGAGVAGAAGSRCGSSAGAGRRGCSAPRRALTR